MGVEDQTLLTKAREFDEDALETIYQKYSDSLFKYAVRKVGDPARAEDFVAEISKGFYNRWRKEEGRRNTCGRIYTG